MLYFEILSQTIFGAPVVMQHGAAWRKNHKKGPNMHVFDHCGIICQSILTKLGL
jgi:hypothetical protein